MERLKAKKKKPIKTRKKQIIFNIFTYTLKYNTDHQGNGSWGGICMDLCLTAPPRRPRFESGVRPGPGLREKGLP